MLKIEEMKQPGAEEIADSWKYDGWPRGLWGNHVSKFDGNRYFSVFDNEVLIGFFFA